MNRDELKNLKVGDLVHVLCDEDPEAVPSSEDMSDDYMPRGEDYVIVQKDFEGNAVAVATAVISAYTCQSWVRTEAGKPGELRACPTCGKKQVMDGLHKRWEHVDTASPDCPKSGIGNAELFGLGIALGVIKWDRKTHEVIHDGIRTSFGLDEVGVPQLDAECAKAIMDAAATEEKRSA